MKKIVFITGASSGIGKSTAGFLTQRGYVVYGSSRNPEKFENLPFTLLAMDVTNEASIREAVETIIRKEGRIDVLINNAGVGITGPVEEIPSEEINKVFQTNLYGPIEVMKAVLPHMRNQGGGLIINITSIAGYMGLPYRALYSATKGALNLVTEGMRMETKDFGVKITTLAPGDFATNIASGRYHAPVYETSAYKTPYGNTLKLINGHVNDGKDPLEVAKMVLKIMQTPNPKPHYKVGAFMQRFSVVLKKLLPGKVYEKLLVNHYKL